MNQELGHELKQGEELTIDPSNVDDIDLLRDGRFVITFLNGQLPISTTDSDRVQKFASRVRSHRMSLQNPHDRIIIGLDTKNEHGVFCIDAEQKALKEVMGLKTMRKHRVTSPEMTRTLLQIGKEGRSMDKNIDGLKSNLSNLVDIIKNAENVFLEKSVAPEDVDTLKCIYKNMMKMKEHKKLFDTGYMTLLDKWAN